MPNPKIPRCFACNRGMRGEDKETVSARTRENKERKRVADLEAKIVEQRDANNVLREMLLCFLFANEGRMEVPQRLLGAIQQGRYGIEILPTERESFIIISAELIEEMQEMLANRPRIIPNSAGAGMPGKIIGGPGGTPIIDINKLRG
jgi:hypothetical protein